MKIKVKANEPKDNKLEAKLTIAAADVDAAIKRTYASIANQYRFQGFRKGKAPRPLIDNLIGKQAVLAQASEDLLNDATPLMLDQLDVVPVGQTSFGDEPTLAEEGKDYVLTATISLRPDCELKSYDAVEINMPPASATEAEIDEQIEVLLGYHAKFEDVSDDYKAAEGDMLTLDVENIENGESLAGEDRPFMLGSSVAPAEFDKAIKGMKIGASKKITYTVAGAEHTDAKGKAVKDDDIVVTVKAKLKSAKKHIVPELNDELAKKAFGFDNVKKFREAVAEEVTEDKASQLPNLKETRVIEKLAERLKLKEVPEDYQKQIFDEIVQDFLGQLQRQGLTLDSWLQARQIQVSDFLADLNEQAAERARQSLALDALAKHLKLEASVKEVRAQFEDANVDDVDATMADFAAAGRMPAVRETVKRMKAVEWLVDNAKVTEVDEVAERRGKKPAAKKAAAKKTTAKSTATKKAASDKATTKKPASEKTATKKSATTKKAVSTKKAPDKKASK